MKNENGKILGDPGFSVALLSRVERHQRDKGLRKAEMI